MKKTAISPAVLTAMLCAILGIAVAAQPKQPDCPVITPVGGTYAVNAKVRVSIRGERGSRIVYTLDGENPDVTRGIRAESNVVFFDLPPGDVTVKAVAVMPGLPKSAIRRADFVRRG